MEVVNLTPHQLNILNRKGEPVAIIEPSGTVARCTVQRELTDTVDGIPLYRTEFGSVEDLPEYEDDNIIYVVSGIARAAVPDRLDVFQPGELVRDDDGRPIGCIGLSR